MTKHPETGLCTQRTEELLAQGRGEHTPEPWHICPDCRNAFVQPFVCITCGALKLHNHTTATLERENAALREQRQEWLVANGPGGWIDDLRQQRDRLAEALRECVNACRTGDRRTSWTGSMRCPNPTIDGPAFARAEILLAELERK